MSTKTQLERWLRESNAQLARAREIIEKQREAIDLLIGEIVQCCDITDQPTNEVIRTARAALALKLDEKP